MLGMTQSVLGTQGPMRSACVIELKVAEALLCLGDGCKDPALVLVGDDQMSRVEKPNVDIQGAEPRLHSIK